MRQKYQWIFTEALKLKGVSIDYKVEWQAYRFLLNEKMFAYLGTNNHAKEILTLKGDPADNRLMIEIYDCVTEGYYMNKIHWISIRLDDPKLPSKQMVVEQLIKSYQLVFEKLSKKHQQKIRQ